MSLHSTSISPSYALILPAHNEEEALPLVLQELAGICDDLGAVVAVGANGCSDATAFIARDHGVVVGECAEAGYGHGCMAAINALQSANIRPGAYLFVSADGANAPRDIHRMVQTYRRTGFPMVVGERTCLVSNWRTAGASRALPNVTLGLWCTLLTGRPWLDLGPLRVIDADLFMQMELRELVWGWTIEAQVLAGRLGVPVARIGVEERPRLAGEQKVSGVSIGRSLRIGLSIVAAGWRTRWRIL